MMQDCALQIPRKPPARWEAHITDRERRKGDARFVGGTSTCRVALVPEGRVLDNPDAGVAPRGGCKRRPLARACAASAAVSGFRPLPWAACVPNCSVTVVPRKGTIDSSNIALFGTLAVPHNPAGFRSGRPCEPSVPHAATLEQSLVGNVTGPE